MQIKTKYAQKTGTERETVSK